MIVQYWQGQEKKMYELIYNFYLTERKKNYRFIAELAL